MFEVGGGNVVFQEPNVSTPADAPESVLKSMLMGGNLYINYT